MQAQPHTRTRPTPHAPCQHEAAAGVVALAQQPVLERVHLTVVVRGGGVRPCEVRCVRWVGVGVACTHRHNKPVYFLHTTAPQPTPPHPTVSSRDWFKVNPTPPHPTPPHARPSPPAGT